MPYHDGLREYYVATENILSKDAGIDIAIYYKDIRLMDNSIILSEVEKKKIASDIKIIMEQKGRLSVGILPV